MHVKEPTSTCSKNKTKRVGLTACGMETRKHRTQQQKRKSWVAPYYGCLLFPLLSLAQISRALLSNVICHVTAGKKPYTMIMNCMNDT